VRHAKHTQELSTREEHVHQISVLKERKSCQTELVKLVQNTAEQPVIIRDVPLKYVLPDRFSKSMEDAPNATNIPELTLKESFVSHITVMIDKS